MPPLLVVVLAFLLVGIVLTRPVGTLLAGRAEHSQRDLALGPLVPEHPTLEQPFTARADNFASITVNFGTFGSALHCDVRVTLFDDGGTTLSDQTRPCSSLRDNRPTKVVTLDAPVAASTGRHYLLRISLVGSATGPVVWGGTSQDLEAATIDGKALGGAADFLTGYQGHGRVYASLGLVLRRVSVYGAVWTTPAFLLLDAAAIVAVLAALAWRPRRMAGVLLVALAVTRGLLWDSVLPPFAGPDEPAHVAYAQLLAERHVPPKRGAQDGLPGYSPDLGTGAYVMHTAGPNLDRPYFDPAGIAATKAALHADLSHKSGQNSAAAGYSPGYYLVPAVLEKLPGSVDERLGFMRLWSIALGAAAVWLAYRIGMRLFGGHDGAAVLLAVALALQPMYTQQTTMVSNDAALLAGGALCLLVSLQLADRHRPEGWRLPARKALRRLPVVPLAFCAGGALGLVVLAKPTGLIWVGVVGAGWLVGRVRSDHHPPLWRDLLGLAAGFLAAYGPWLVYATVGGYPGISYAPETPPGSTTYRAFVRGLVQNDFRVVRRNFDEEFWGRFGWLNVSLPGWVYVTMGVLSLVLVAGAALWLAATGVDATRRVVRRATAGAGAAPEDVAAGCPEARRQRDDLAVNTGLCVLAVAGTVGGLLTVMGRYFHHNGLFDFMQGRYLLMMLPALLALPGLLARRFAPRLSPVVPMAATASLMLGLQILGLTAVLNAFYL